MLSIKRLCIVGAVLLGMVLVQYLLDALTMTQYSLEDSASTDTIRDDKILFLIFAGGPSGFSDMEAILDTWGNQVDLALVMSNTPRELPLQRIGARNNRNSSWQVRPSATLGGGPDRPAEVFWKETISFLVENFQNYPDLKWIVRSDSDTWWNVKYLRRLLLEENRLPANDTLVMGECYGLENGRWVEYLAHPINNIKRDNGMNCYLAGGAGLVFTRAAVDVFSSCLSAENHPPKKCWGKEDIWLSCMARKCGFSLTGQPGMFQRPDQFDEHMKRNGTMSKTLAIHRAVGDGRNGWEHPSYYDQLLLESQGFD